MEEEGAEFIGKGHNLTGVIEQLAMEVRESAANLELELARRLRDEVKKLHDVEIGQGVEKVMGPADSGRLRVFQQGSMHSAHR